MKFLSQRKTTPGRQHRKRRRQVVGAPSAQAATEPRRRLVRASRRTYFDLYAPRTVITKLRTNSFWKEYRPKFLALALLVLFSAALYEFFAGDSFYVSQIVVNGSRLVPVADIEQTAGIRGWNLFYLNARDVEASIKKMPEVKDAQVSVDFPDLVQVQIVEREPRFIWQTPRGSYWVDDDGIAVRVRFDAPNLLTMKDLDSALIRPGDRVNPEAFNAAVNLRNLWRDGPREFEWSKAHGLTVHDSHGWLVYFGSPSQMADKLAALKIVSAQLTKDKHSIDYVDVGSGLPYYREVATKH